MTGTQQLEMKSLITNTEWLLQTQKYVVRFNKILDT